MLTAPLSLIPHLTNILMNKAEYVRDVITSHQYFDFDFEYLNGLVCVMIDGLG